MKKRVEAFATDVRKVMYEDIKSHQIKVFLQSFADLGNTKLPVINTIERLFRMNQPITRESIGMANGECDSLSNKSKAMLRKILADEVMGDWDIKRETFTGKFEVFDSAFDRLKYAIDSNKSSEELKKLANELYCAATNKIQENESEYGVLKGQVENLWRAFDLFVEPSKVLVQKKEFVHPTVLKKVKDFVKNNADKIAKTTCSGSARDEAIMKAKDELTKQLTEMLNIPEDKKDEVLESPKYKHFMNLCYSLRNRMVDEIVKKHWEDNGYSYEAKEFVQAIWKALCELVNYFGLLPEITQVSTLKESSDDWTRFVAVRGSEVVKEHSLIPKNIG